MVFLLLTVRSLLPRCLVWSSAHRFEFPQLVAALLFQSEWDPAREIGALGAALHSSTHQQSSNVTPC